MQARRRHDASFCAEASSNETTSCVGWGSGSEQTEPISCMRSVRRSGQSRLPTRIGSLIHSSSLTVERIGSTGAIRSPVLANTRQAGKYAFALGVVATLALMGTTGCRDQTGLGDLDACIKAGEEGLSTAGQSEDVTCDIPEARWVVAMPRQGVREEDLIQAGLNDASASLLMKGQGQAPSRLCTVVEYREHRRSIRKRRAHCLGGMRGAVARHPKALGGARPLAHDPPHASCRWVRSIGCARGPAERPSRGRQDRSSRHQNRGLRPDRAVPYIDIDSRLQGPGSRDAWSVELGCKAPAKGR